MIHESRRCAFWSQYERPVATERRLSGADIAAKHVEPYFGDGAPDVSFIATAIVQSLIEAGWRCVVPYGRVEAGVLYLDLDDYENRQAREVSP